MAREAEEVLESVREDLEIFSVVLFLELLAVHKLLHTPILVLELHQMRVLDKQTVEVGLPVERRQEVKLEAVPWLPAVLPLMRVAVLAAGQAHNPLS